MYFDMFRHVVIESYDVDDAAAWGIQKGEKSKDRENWIRCANLAIAWNNIEVAREHIFTTENRYHYQVSDVITGELDL